MTGSLGEKVYDTATVTGIRRVHAHGHGDLRVLHDASTARAPHVDQTVTLSGGVVPNSATTAALAAGSYSYIGVYSGDSNYKGFTGAVEPLSISPPQSLPADLSVTKTDGVTSGAGTG